MNFPFCFVFFFVFSGDIQPIASQVIDLAKKKSNDNISVIAVFFKDPKQILAEYKARDSNQLVTSMDFESANGCHIDTVNALTANNECATKVVDTMAMETNEFYFGKNDEDNYHTEGSIQSNGDGDKFSSHEAIDDFGPETDVDATDDNAISPISPSVSEITLYHHKKKKSLEN